MSSGPMGKSPWSKRIFDRLGGIFDQLREILADLDILSTTGLNIPPPNLVFALLRDPDNADTPDMNVDGSVTDRTFRYTVPPGQTIDVERLNFAAADNAKDVPNGFFSLGELGANNGCLLRVLDTDDSVLLDFLDGGEIRRTTEFELLAGVDADSDSTANISRHGVRFTIEKAGESMILMADQSVEFTIRANLSGLELFRVMIQGKRI